MLVEIREKSVYGNVLCSLHALVESNGEVNGENLSEYIQNIKKS